MPVFIYQEDALDRMSMVEGEAWRKLQQRNRDSPQGFFAWLKAWHQLETDGYAGQVDVGLYVEYNDGVIYGEGGYARYRVRNNGEIVLLGSSTRPEKVAKAKEQGFTV